MTTKTSIKTRTSPRATVPGRLLFRYRGQDSVAGVSRKTAVRLAKALGLTETQAIHLALARLAKETLPRYEADDGPLTAAQMNAIKKLEPQGRMVASESLFG
jgi:antitoxin component of RelBE/YafQ-DinJ toxin-antitoxin module